MPRAGTVSTDPLVMASMTSNAWGSADARRVSPRCERMFPQLLRRIARVLPSLKGRITLAHATYDHAPDVEATWFVDPPYQVTQANKLNSGYRHTVNHSELGRWVLGRDGQIIACDQVGADWLPFEPLVNARDSTGRLRTEAVFTSSPMTADQELARLRIDLGGLVPIGKEVA